jgi:hypothetical protein
MNSGYAADEELRHPPHTALTSIVLEGREGNIVKAVTLKGNVLDRNGTGFMLLLSKTTGPLAGVRSPCVLGPRPQTRISGRDRPGRLALREDKRRRRDLRPRPERSEGNPRMRPPDIHEATVGFALAFPRLRLGTPLPAIRRIERSLLARAEEATVGFEPTHGGVAGPDCGDLDPCSPFAGFRVRVCAISPARRTQTLNRLLGLGNGYSARLAGDRGDLAESCPGPSSSA